jgi:hypothetical protein
MYFLNDGALYSETLDRRHVCGNALRMSAAWSFVAESSACRLGTGRILSEQIETPSNSDLP